VLISIYSLVQDVFLKIFAAVFSVGPLLCFCNWHLVC
jgi:hypothetical protein